MEAINLHQFFKSTSKKVDFKFVEITSLLLNTFYNLIMISLIRIVTCQLFAEYVYTSYINSFRN